MGSSRTTLYIDGRAMMYRAFYAFDKAKTRDGKPNGLLQGFPLLLADALRGYKGTDLLVVWDACDKDGRGTGTWRHRYFPEYKQNRKPQGNRELIYEQYPALLGLIQSLGVKQIMVADMEADDLIGILTARAGEHKIFSNDEDFFQLLDRNTTILKPAGGGGVSEVTYDSVLRERGIDPRRWVTFKTLCGDSSDNYKGLPGCGPVKAKTYIEKGLVLGALHPTDYHRANFPELIEHWDRLYQCYVLAFIPRKASYTRIPEDARLVINSLLTDLDTSRSGSDLTNFRDLCTYHELDIVWERRSHILP